MSWLFKSAPAPAPKPDTRRPSTTTPSQVQPQSLNLNAPKQAVGGYDAPKPSAFGFLAPSDVPVSPAPAPAASGFSFVAPAAQPEPVPAPQPSHGFSFVAPAAVAETPASSFSSGIGGGFSFMQAAPPAEVAPTPAPDVMFGGLSFNMPAATVAEPAPVPLFPVQADASGAVPLAAAVSLFPSSLKAAPVKKKRAVKKPGFAREDDGEADNPADSKASEVVPSSPHDMMAMGMERSRTSSEVSADPPATPTTDSLTANRTWSNETKPTFETAPAFTSSVLSGLSIKAPAVEEVSAPASSSLTFLSGLTVKSQPAADAPTSSGLAFLSGMTVKSQPAADAPAPASSMLAGLTLKVEAVPNVLPPTVSEAGIPSPEAASPPASPPQAQSLDVEPEAPPQLLPTPEPASVPVTTPAVKVDAVVPVVVPVVAATVSPPAPAVVQLSEEEQFAAVIGGMDAVARQCKLQLFDLKSKKASIIATEAATASTIVKLRTSIRSAEADQNAAIDVEDFARAESLDASIAEWKSALDAAERKQAGFARELETVDDAIDALFQKGLTTVTETVLQLQTHAEKRRSALDTFIAESDKRSRQSMDRIANEEEQLRLKQEHVDLDEKLVVEEQQQVEAAIDVQTSENMAVVHELRQRHTTLITEIADLEALLKQKRLEATSTAAKLAEVEGKVSTIRAKFSKQLERLRTKRQLVDTEKHECAVETEAVAKARREWEDRKRDDTNTISKSRAHITTVSAESVLTSKLREAMAAVSTKRRMRLGAGASSGAAASQLRQLRVALDDAIAQVRTLSKKRSDLDGVVSKCRDAIAAIDTKLPALNEEKKAVVAARKFKEAAKVQADIKQLSEEKAEEEAQLADTVRSIDKCDSELDQWKTSVESFRSRIGALEAEADAEKVSVLTQTIVDIRRRLRKLGKVPGRLDVSSSCAYSAASAFLDAELEIARDELNALTSKHGMTCTIPDETDSDEEVGPAPTATPQATPTLQAEVAASALADKPDVPVDELLYGLDTPPAPSTNAFASEDVVAPPDVAIDAPVTDDDDPVSIMDTSRMVKSVSMSSRSRSDILSDMASTRDDIAELESNMEAAVSEENYDEADRYQGEIDELTNKLSTLQAELDALPAA